MEDTPSNVSIITWSTQCVYHMSYYKIPPAEQTTLLMFFSNFYFNFYFIFIFFLMEIAYLTRPEGHSRWGPTLTTITRGRSLLLLGLKQGYPLHGPWFFKLWWPWFNHSCWRQALDSTETIFKNNKALVTKYTSPTINSTAGEGDTGYWCAQSPT